MTNNPASPSTEPLSAKISRAEIDIGLRRFMLGVYNYMASGLALTGIVAYIAAESGLYASLVEMPLLFWAIVLTPLALVFFLSFRIESMSLGAAQAAFWAYAGLVGLSLSGIFLISYWGEYRSHLLHRGGDISRHEPVRYTPRAPTSRASARSC